MGIYLMAKDKPVLEIENDRCRVLEENLLPFSLRKESVALEDFYGSWIGGRAIQMSRTNSKMILNSVRVSQTNAFSICKSCYGLSMTDMYWLKEKENPITWDEINLFDNTISRGMASTALLGDVLKETGKIRTPELTAQGVTAKAWVKRDSDIFLYKIGKKELAASAIFDALEICHVTYEKVVGEELDSVASPQRKEQLQALGEEVVKCKIISSPERSMVNFEDFQIFCENHGKNVYEEIKRIDREHYLQMQVGDYIINNTDRHTANWGFFMDNETGEITALYPLIDHDHAFSDVEGMLSLTTEESIDLQTAALLAQSELHLNLTAVMEMEMPEGIGDQQWAKVQQRAFDLKECCRVYEDIMESGYRPTWELIDSIRRLESRSESVMKLNDLIMQYNRSEESVEEVERIMNILREQIADMRISAPEI